MMMNPLALSLTLAMGVLLLLLPKKYALVPFLIVVCYVTLGQRIQVASMGFTMLRIMIIFGSFRLVVKREYENIEMNTLDKYFIGWVISVVFFYTILHGNYQAFNNRMGHAYDAVGVYFIARCFLKDVEDVINFYKILSLLILPLAVLMIVEGITHKNMFSIFGGVPLVGEMREGHVRCQGSFAHPILAGTFGATLTPVFLGLWFQKDTGRKFAILGSIAATVITISSQSSGPLMAYIFGIIGMFMWRFRFRMRMVRWGIVAILSIAHMLMKAPVWFLIARISDLTGGSGWHRSELIEQTIRHFDEWWLCGTKNTTHWMDAPNPSNPDMVDITNWFVGQATNGGIITLIIFMFIIVQCYKLIGVSLINSKNIDHNDIFVWSLGASVTAHITSFISVSYFDQIVVFWYFLVASICSLSKFISSRKIAETDGMDYPINSVYFES